MNAIVLETRGQYSVDKNGGGFGRIFDCAEDETRWLQKNDSIRHPRQVLHGVGELNREIVVSGRPD